MRRLFRFVVLMKTIAALTLLSTAIVFGAGERNNLWHVVSSCIDMASGGYCAQCRFPRTDSVCLPVDCRDATEVWAESEQFVVVRDRKMCGCPEGFVHGLAMPRQRVSGVEDPGRPDGIWRFAWDIAAKMVEEDDIALVVNPKRLRSQDQLHVHIVRLGKNRLPTDPGRTAVVDSLDKVWRTAASKATLLGWQDYGVLVARDSRSGRYIVVVDEGSPEKKYTEWTCR